MLAGIFLIIFHMEQITLIMFLGLKIASNGFKCAFCSPNAYNIAQMITGIFFCAWGLLGISYSLSPERAGYFFNRHYKNIMMVIVIALILFITFNSFNRFLDGDEGEYIHAAWHISHGDAPYSDFFEIHHMMLPYLIAITIKIFGENLFIFYLWRGIMLVFVFIFAYLTFMLARKFFGKKIAWLSVILLLTNIFFFIEMIKIRTDVPQVVFSLASIYYFDKFLDKKSNLNIALSGIFMGISFLFLQKAIFVIAALGAVILYEIITRKIKFRHLLIFCLALGITILPYYTYLAGTGQIKNYILFNWLFNMNYTDYFSIIYPLARWLFQNSFLWLFILIGGYCFIKEKNKEGTMIFILFLLLLLSIATVRVPFRNYFLILTPLMAIMAAYGFSRLLKNQQKILALAVIFAVIMMPLVQMAAESADTNYDDIEKIKFVMQNTGPADYVYDPLRFNFYRKDIDFLWFNQGYGASTLKKIIPDYHYDVYEAIKRYNPKIISTDGIDINNPLIMENYAQTKYPEFLIRK